MSIVIDLKNAIKSIDTLISLPYPTDNKHLTQVKFTLQKRLDNLQELLHNDEIPDAVMEEWANMTEDELRFANIKWEKL